MEESILTSIKKLIGPSASYDYFDSDLIMHINMALMFLSQMGIGTKGFTITDDSATWHDFISDIENFESAKTYVYLKTKLIFDPPTSSAVIQVINDAIKECEWRLNSRADYEKN